MADDLASANVNRSYSLAVIRYFQRIQDARQGFAIFAQETP